MKPSKCVRWEYSSLFNLTILFFILLTRPAPLNAREKRPSLDNSASATDLEGGVVQEELEYINSIAHNEPKLVYLAPSNPKRAYTLNDKNSLTNHVTKGWLIKSGKELELSIYMIVPENLSSVNEVKFAYIFFTSNESSCDTSNYIFEDDGKASLSASSEQQNLIYKLEISNKKSRFHEPTNSLEKKAGAGSSRRRKPKQANMEKTAKSTLIYGKVKLRLEHTSSSYYSCIHFSKRNSSADALTAKDETTSASKRLLRFTHQGEQNPLSQIVTTKDYLPLFLVIIFYFILTCFSALFSGLNLGLMSLDLGELSILKKIGTKREQRYAKKIFPLRKRGNLLLCTILIGNVLVNSISTLILGSYLEGVFAALGSTLIIVIFGEIIPQAICSRYGLAVGAFTRYITYTFMCLTFFVSYPMSKLLDLILGKEIAVTFSREKVRELMRQAAAEDIKDEQKKFISGALDFKTKTVADIMVPIKDVFSLNISAELDFDTFKTILYHGYSRIPVYDTEKENLVGILLIQDLLLNDPADKVPLRAVLDYFKHQMPKCKPSDKLENMFEKFRYGDTHMAIVYASTSNLNEPTSEGKEAVGIVTLENVIETLIQNEIMDEADFKRERRKKKAKNMLKGKLANLSLSSENLNIFVTEDDQTNKPIISPQIRKALFYFLASTIKPFAGEFINPKLLETFLRSPDLTKEKRNLSNEGVDANMFIYKFGEECDYFTIIVDGKALLQVGKEGMEISAGLFSFYGVSALLGEDNGDMTPNDIVRNENVKKPYVPEFSLFVDSYCVYLQINRRSWIDLIKKSMMERTLRPNSPFQIVNTVYNHTTMTTSGALATSPSAPVVAAVNAAAAAVSDINQASNYAINSSTEPNSSINATNNNNNNNVKTNVTISSVNITVNNVDDEETGSNVSINNNNNNNNNNNVSTKPIA